MAHNPLTLLPIFAILGGSTVATPVADGGNRPIITKLGTIDLLMVETTPVVFKDRLYRFEYVRENYHANKTGASYSGEKYEFEVG